MPENPQAIGKDSVALSSHKPYPYDQEASQSLLIRKLAAHEQEKFPQKNLFLINDSVIFPEETGITNSTDDAELQSPQDFQGKHFIYEKEADNENLLQYQPILDLKLKYVNDLCNYSLISREKAIFKQKFNPSRSIDQEYRRNPAVIEKHSHVIEVPRGSGDRFKFQCITKNFSTELNHNIIRLLEFREKLFMIQNFDTLNFTKTFDTIEIQESIPSVEYDYYADLCIYMCRGVVGRMKYILSKIENKDIRDLMIKEVLITLYLTNSVKFKERKGVLELVFYNWQS
jgi:hypothetical protein